MKTPKSLLFILMTVFLDTIGIGLLIPIFPQIMKRFSTDPQIISEHFGIFVGSYALAQFLASPILGALSDRFGRKLVLLCSLLGATIDYLFMAYAPTFSFLIIARMISGLTGASMTVATAYVVDVSDEKDRASNFGLLGAAWGLGFIAGPILGSTLDLLGPFVPFWVAAILNLINFIFGWWVLPESLRPENRRPIVLKAFNPFRSLFKILTLPSISTFVWTYFFIFLAGQSFVVNWYLYTELKFQWTTMQMGLSLSFLGIVIAFSQGVLTRTIIPRLGEVSSVTLGLCFYILSFLGFGLASQSWMMYVTILVFSLTGVAAPSLQSLASQCTPDQEQGELHGSLISLENLASVLAPLIFTPLFTTFSKPTNFIYFPGIVFVASSFMCFLTLIFWLFFKNQPTKE